MPALPTRLARKWCPAKRHLKENRVEDYEDTCFCWELMGAVREALGEAEKTASLWSMKPDRSFHPDIPWEQMNETAQMVAHSTAQQIAAALAALRKSVEE